MCIKALTGRRTTLASCLLRPFSEVRAWRGNSASGFSPNIYNFSLSLPPVTPSSTPQQDQDEPTKEIRFLDLPSLSASGLMTIPGKKYLLILQCTYVFYVYSGFFLRVINSQFWFLFSPLQGFQKTYIEYGRGQDYWLRVISSLVRMKSMYITFTMS